MPLIRFITPSGERIDVAAQPGQSILSAALRIDLPALTGECGGFLNCATCHAYVDEKWIDRLPPVSEDEDGMLDWVANRRPNSRLTCQLSMTADLDGIEIFVPDIEAG